MRLTMKKRYISILTVMIVLAMMSLAVFAETIYPDGHEGSQHNYCSVTDHTRYIEGVVQIKGSYVDRGYHCYLGGIRYLREDSWGSGFELTPVYYTAYATGPNDSTIRTKTLSDDHPIVPRYTYSFSAYFYWVPDGTGVVWPVSLNDPEDTV